MMLLELLGKALGVLRLLTASTKTIRDDQFVDLLQAIYDSPALLAYFQKLLASAPQDSVAAGTLSLTADAPEDIVLELRDRKIPWATIVEYAPAVLSLLRMLMSGGTLPLTASVSARSVRAKFKCESKEPNAHNPADGNVIKLEAVTSGSAENEQFFKYTPSASLTLQTVNPQASEQFEVGKEYYLDISAAG